MMSTHAGGQPELPDEFRVDFERTTLERLRRRSVWWCVLVLVFSYVATLTGVYLADAGSDDLRPALPLVEVAGLRTLILGLALGILGGLGRRLDRAGIVLVVTATFIALVLAQGAAVGRLTEVLRDVIGMHNLGFGVPWLLFTAGLHVLTALLVPWRPREAFLAMMPIAVGAAALLWGGLSSASAEVRLAVPLLLVLAALPGTAIAFLRGRAFQRRFHLETLDARYGMLRRELESARRIHEAVFPAPTRSGRLAFRSAYEPADELGGDFVFVRAGEVSGGDTMHAIVIDVTGHGVAAALTVTRLHGELSRLYAESPELAPSAVVPALNRYLRLALQHEGIFATAFALRATERDGGGVRVQWLSAGHPAAIVVRGGEVAEELSSTAPMLGVGGEEIFAGTERTLDLRPGDAIVACTDGVIETRVEGGEMLEPAGWRAVLATALGASPGPDGLADRLRDEVARQRAGPPLDDTLVVVVAV